MDRGGEGVTEGVLDGDRRLAEIKIFSLKKANIENGIFPSINFDSLQNICFDSSMSMSLAVSMSISMSMVCPGLSMSMSMINKQSLLKHFCKTNCVPQFLG
jgi:hypothetical protein